MKIIYKTLKCRAEAGFIQCKENLNIKDSMIGETIVLALLLLLFHWVLEFSGGVYQNERVKEIKSNCCLSQVINEYLTLS